MPLALTDAHTEAAALLPPAERDNLLRSVAAVLDPNPTDAAVARAALRPLRAASRVVRARYSLGQPCAGLGRSRVVALSCGRGRPLQEKSPDRRPGL
jgi:hypothetical protein